MVNVEYDEKESNSSDKEMSMKDFGGQNFLKNRDVGEQLTFEVDKVIDSKKIKQTNKATGVDFNVGLKDREGNYRRIDIYTKSGEVYTVGSWEVYFKLFGNDGILINYATKNNESFRGARVGITRLFNGTHASMGLADLSKVRGTTLEETKVYQEKVKKSIKDKVLYEVVLLK